MGNFSNHLFTISINFGMMGFLDIPLEIGTAIVSSIVIGIGVDFSIHFISRFRVAQDQGKDFEGSLRSTLQSSGKAIVSNAFTVSLGFLALFASEFLPLIVTGWMVALTLMISAFSTLLLIPSMQATLAKIKVMKSPTEVAS